VTAWALVAIGAALPALRRRLRVSPVVVLIGAASAPAAASVVVRRDRLRDVAVCALQMWAYIAAYELPHDDPDRLAQRVKIDYPIAIDRALGLGELPTVRLQRRFSRPGRVNRAEQVLSMCHWIWFAVPHATLAYIWVRAPARFHSAAARMYTLFDIGACFYWVLPTAPPWWAAERGRPLAVRRTMIEYGPNFWGRLWKPLYQFLGGNPLAAMPSMHFATSLMGAELLTEVGPLAGAVGWTYAGALGVALVYLGEHYLIDLLAGAALSRMVQALHPRLAPAYRGVARALARVRRLAADEP
jgi:membrane-associated phospholipid phosphatase